MMQKWHCPYAFCTQSSTRHWNLKVHIHRKHNGRGNPTRNPEQHISDMSLVGIHNYGRNFTKNAMIKNESREPQKIDALEDVSETIRKYVAMLNEVQKLQGQNWSNFQFLPPCLH